MNRGRLLLIGILALTLGALVAFKVYRSLQAKIIPAAVGVDVLVAANSIPVGAKLEDHDLKVVKLPSEAVPPECVPRKSPCGWPRRRAPDREGRLCSALQTGAGKRRFQCLLPDSVPYARGLDQRERRHGRGWFC